MTTSPIVFERLPDGTHELRYADRVIGWAREALFSRRPGERARRAVSIHGEIRHCATREAARATLLSLDH